MDKVVVNVRVVVSVRSNAAQIPNFSPSHLN